MTLCTLGLTFVDAMSSAGDAEPPASRPSVFLSYASEDQAAARSIRDAMDAAGLEVWYDENELGGGDAWDKKIRQQIRECDYFAAVISARTEARHEGYFRREWRLAVERSLDMADDHLFLLPVVIDGTEQAAARVPEKFLAVQWVKVPNGQPNPSLHALCSRLVAGGASEVAAPRRPPPRIGRGRDKPVPAEMPVFPTEEPGQRVKFWVHVIEWAARTAWVLLHRMPKLVRAILAVWFFIFVVGKGCTRDRSEPAAVSPAAAVKLKEIAEKYQGSKTQGDIAKLGADIAREFAKDDDDSPKEASPLLAIPFLAPVDNPAAAKLANSTFALLYGRLSLSSQGKVGLSKDPLLSLDSAAAVQRARDSHSRFVVFGGVQEVGGARVLTVEIIKVSDSTVVWTKDYSIADADPSTIATEVEEKIPGLGDN